MADAQRILKAAKLACSIASSGNYDADSVSRMFEQADAEVKRLVYERTESDSVSRMFLQAQEKAETQASDTAVTVPSQTSSEAFSENVTMPQKTKPQ